MDLKSDARKDDLSGDPGYQPRLYWYAVVTAVATLALVGVGGLVTSRGAGMAVPDWPTTYGYNMFFFPISKWVGGIFYEHSHRLVASLVGVMVVLLTRWCGGRRSRLPLAIIGTAELIAGILLLQLRPNLAGAGHFLSGIGGVVLLGALIWARNQAAPRPVSLLAWIAFGTVQIQGLLGGLRVVLYQDELGIFHATLAQLFFVVLCAVAVLTSKFGRSLPARPQALAAYPALRVMLGITTLLILGQLVLGATMRHQHAGLAIPDFPLAYGKLWPETDPASIQRYNQERLEVTAVKPITAAQVELQMAHRILALVILLSVCGWAFLVRARLGGRHFLARGGYAWAGLLWLQVFLGAATIWSNKAADIATAHVLVGALSLALGAMLCMLEFQELGLAPRRESVPVSPDAFSEGLFALRQPAGPNRS